MKLAGIFCDHMMLQREASVTVFGTGSGELVFEDGETRASFTLTEENWCVFLPPQPAGGPHTLHFLLDGRTQIVRDVWYGDIFLASGQSNMAFKLAETPQRPAETPACVRCYTVKKPWADDARSRDEQWVDCTEENASQCSAIAAFFSKELAAAEGVPVGVIDCSQGASVIESWLPSAALAAEPPLAPDARCEDAVLYPFNPDGYLYRAMLEKILPYSVRGVLWYQGESNRGRGETERYAHLFNCLCREWRAAFRAPSLPFFTVQLMPFADENSHHDWPAMRWQQQLAAARTAGVYLVAAPDAGDGARIHPLDKGTVAHRLFLAVEAVLYTRDTVWRAPKAVCAFAHQEGACVVFDGALSQHGEFLAELRMPDGSWQPAVPTVQGNCLWLAGKAGAREIRTDWANCPPTGLFGACGLPALPCRLETQVFEK